MGVSLFGDEVVGVEALHGEAFVAFSTDSSCFQQLRDEAEAGSIHLVAAKCC
jgi:hypothetical protein